MSTTIGLQLEPLDVLFFRDGRPFGAATRGTSGLPVPQTFAGAMWTALLETHGCDFLCLTRLLREDRLPWAEAVQQAGGPAWVSAIRVRGPWLARPAASGAGLDVLVPVPAALHAGKPGPQPTARELHRLQPLPPDRLPGWESPESAPQLWPLWLKHPQPTEPAAGYLTPAGLRAFLHAEPVGRNQLVGADQLYGYDHRTGIGIDPDRLAAEEGLIYGATFLTLQPGITMYAEVTLPDEAGQTALRGVETLAFGGEGRRVRVQELDQRYAWPEAASPAGGQKPLVLLTTPGLFAGRWQPAALNGRLVAAAVPGSVAVSGWDLARGGPKPNRFAAQAGSTYFLNQPLEPWPETLSDRDGQQGWGCYLKGVWTDEHR